MTLALVLFGALFDSSCEASGDYVRLAGEWAAFAASNPDAPEAELVLVRLGEIAAGAGLPLSALGVERSLSSAAEAQNGSVALKAAELLARIRRERGDPEGARAIFLRAGYVPSWAYCGPFGMNEAGARTRSFAPEFGLDLAAEYDSWGWPAAPPRRSRWKTIVPSLPGDLALSELVWPRRGCVYLLAQIKVPSACEALVEVRSTSWCRAWLGGELAMDRDVASSESPDCTRLRVRLGEGWTGLLVKAPYSSDLSARIVDAKCRPLRGVEFERDLTLHEWSDASHFLGLARDTPAAVDALRGSGDVSRAMHALALHYEGMDGEAVAEFDTVAEFSPSALTLYGSIVSGWADAPETWRKNRSRALYQRAIEKGEFVPARLGLGRILAREGKHKEALEELGKALDKFPGSPLVKIEMASVARDAGWLNESRLWMSEGEKLLPKSIKPHLFWADLYGERGNNLRAASEFRKVLSLDARGSTLRALADICGKMGEWSDAVAVRQQMVGARPQSLRERLELASALLDGGRRKEALAQYRALVSEHPDHPDPVRKLGYALIELGLEDEALGYLGKASDLRPEDDATRRLVETLRDEEEDFSQAYALDVGEYIRRSEKVPRDTRASRWLILDQTVIRVHPDGSYTEYTHWAQKILTPDGIEDLKHVDYRGEIVELRNLRPDGTVLEPTVLRRGSDVTIPGLEVGSTVECRYRNFSPAPSDGHVRLSPWFFQGPEPMVPHLVSDYVVIVPESMNLKVVKRNWRERGPTGEEGEELPDPSPARQDGYLVYRWTVRNMPAVRIEPGMEDRETVLPYIEIATPWTPAECASDLASTVGASKRLTPAIRDKADQLAPGGDPEARVRAAYEFVCSEIKGDEGRWSANAILLSRSGDRNLLLAALLRAMGLDVRMARVRPAASRVKSDAGFAEPAWELLRPDMFVYSCVCVLTGTRPIWLDAANRYTPFGLLPETLQGGAALLEEGALLTVPVLSDESNGIFSSLRLEVRDDGSAAAEGTEEILGATGAAYKRALEGRDAAWQNTWLQDRLSERVPGAEVVSFSMPGLQEPGTPFKMRYELRLRGVLQGERVKLHLPKLQLSRLVTESERNFPRKLSDAIWRQDIVEIELCETATFAPLPEPLAARRAFGSFSLSLSGGTKKVVVRRSVHVPCQSVPPGLFPDFARFCRKCDTAEELTLPLHSRGKGASAE